MNSSCGIKAALHGWALCIPPVKMVQWRRSLANHSLRPNVARSFEQDRLVLRAIRPIAAGEVVLVERPLALTIAHNARAHYCSICLADSRKQEPASSQWEKRCEDCGSQFWCSDACAQVAAKFHCGTECSAFAKWARAGTKFKAGAFRKMEEDDIDTVAQWIHILANASNGTTADVGIAGVMTLASLVKATQYLEVTSGLSGCAH